MPTTRTMLAGLCLLFALMPVPARSDIKSEAVISETLARWTDDFNAGRADKICDLFAPDLRYDYRGFPERGFDDICALLHRSLGDRTRRYRYSLRIKEVIVSGDLAVVRLVWTLAVRPAGQAADLVSEEPGMDVFRRQWDGRWKIVRYIAYEE